MSRHLVVMGVSGCGKSTVAAGLSERAGLVLADADRFHPEANIVKMSAGVPLTDADRQPGWPPWRPGPASTSGAASRP